MEGIETLIRYPLHIILSRPQLILPDYCVASVRKGWVDVAPKMEAVRLLSSLDGFPLNLAGSNLAMVLDIIESFWRTPRDWEINLTRDFGR